MSMYSLLENAIYKCEQGLFQKACEYYLVRNYKGEVYMPGGMEDKDKTRPGRPDLYVYSEQKRFLLCEVTTHDELNADKYAAKLKKDLKDCLNLEKLKLKNGEVARIILGTNGTPPPALRKELEEIVKPHGIPFEVLGFRRLVDFYYDGGKLWARDNLGIPFPTGQIIDKTEFLRQYGRKPGAAPLDNPLFGRETELDNLVKAIEKDEIIVMTGKPGVGKSRLALSAIDAFIEKYPWYQALFVVTTGQAIADDLATFLHPGGFYIVMIDDANRQLESLRPALAKSLNVGIHVKFLMTVRDYAKNDLKPYLRDRNAATFILNKLEDEVIHRILYHPPFGMTDNLVRNRIVQVSKGNARLAIIATEAYMNAQDITILDDTSKIYEEYFSTVIEDQSILSDRQTILVLGMLSFFQSLESDDAETEPILSDFGIPIADYNRIIHVLEDLELIEYRHGVAKIADQVLGTYFFYLCFIRKKFYPAEQLLQNYFERYEWRVKDTFIPSILAFGIAKVLGRPPRLLDNFLNWAKGHTVLSGKILDVFALYVPNHVFAHILEQIEQTPDAAEGYDFNNAYKQAQPTIYDRPLRLLEIFYEGSNKHFITALDLAIAYVDKHRSLLDVLLHQLRNQLNLGEEEARAKFQKIIGLYDHLQPKVAGSFPHKVIFYYGMQRVLLGQSYPIVVYEKRQGKFDFKPAFAALRNRFLAELEQNFDIDRELIFDLLMDYLEPGNRTYYKYLESDQAQMAGLIKKRMLPARMDDTYFVQEYINLLLDKNIPLTAETKALQRRFVNKDYAIIRDLAAERNADRKPFRDYENFMTTADKRIDYVKKHVKLKTLADLDKVHEAILRFKQFKYWHKKHIEAGFGWAIEGVFNNDITLGFEMLASYLQKGNQVCFNPIRLFNTIFKADNQYAFQLYETINADDYRDKENWLDNFYEYYPEQLIDAALIEQMVTHFNNRLTGYELHTPWFEKYETVQPGTISRIVHALYDKHQSNPAFRYKLTYDFFVKYPYLAENELEFAKKLYLDMENIDPSFDPRASGLFHIMGYESSFFTDYIDLRVKKYKDHFTAPRNALTDVWRFGDAPALTYDAIIKISDVNLSGIGMEDFGASLFIQLKPEALQVALPILKRVLTDYPQDLRKIDMVMSIGRRYLPKEHYQELIREWLMLNKSLEDFERIDWTNHDFDYANGLPGNQRIRTYNVVVDAIEVMPENYRYARHKLFLDARIDREHRIVAEEVKMIYRGLL